MRRIAATAAALLCLACPQQAGGEDTPPPPCTPEEARLRYNQAESLLEDTRYSNVEAVPALLEAAAESYVPAAALLLTVYEGRKKGLDAQLEKAYALATRLASQPQQQDPAAEELRRHAMYSLARYHEKGYGWTENDAESKKKSMREAFRWMKKSAEAGNNTACAELARYYMMGIGTATDYRKAWDLLHSTAKRAPRTPKVYLYMGTMCAYGLGGPKDARAAARLFHTGAAYGDASCMNNLAAMLERGIGTRKDKEMAATLYRKAAAMGNKEASTNMQRLVFKGDDKDHAPQNSPRTRIDNALLRVIGVLPVGEHYRQALRRILVSTPQ